MTTSHPFLGKPPRAELTLFDLDQPAQPVAVFSDREYQVRGVHKIVDGLASGGRGQLRAACGTGKTRMARWIAERVTSPDGIVVVAAPSVALVDQTLREWAEAGLRHRALAVCSDDSVLDDSSTHVVDILEPVTTDPDVISAWLRTEAGPGLRLIVGTHVSAHLIGIGLQQAAQRADLLVVDEAHHTAGHTDKHAALLHDDEVVPADRRLYMTATARIDVNRRGVDTPTFSMDDESIYGPVLFSYPFSEAISDGWLDDYRLAVIGVTRSEVLAVLRGSTGGNLDCSQARAATVQVATARAAAQFGLRRIIVFTRTVREAERFAATFPDTLAKLPPQLRPDRPLHADHVHGDMNTARRRKVLSRLAEPPKGGWSVVANARCLSEGVDVPTVDCIAFTAPKRSVIDIVQAVGRALRRAPEGSGVATILVPILLPDDPDAGEQAVDAGNYEVLWEVVQALRAHDDLFSAELATCRASGYTDPNALRRVHFDIPGPFLRTDFLQHLTVRLVKSATSRWWDKFAVLKQFHNEHGHVRVDRDHITDGGFALGIWTRQQRTAYNQRRLEPDRIQAMLDLGFDFNPRSTQWATGLRAATEFHAKFKHLRVPKGYTSHGIRLDAWMRKQRTDARRGMLADSRLAALRALDDAITVAADEWPQRLAEATAYAQQHGHLQVDGRRETQYKELARWLACQRDAQYSGILPADHVAALEALGIRWLPSFKLWQSALRAAREFRQANGHLLPEPDLDGETLAAWLRKRRSDRAEGKLTTAQIAELDELDMVWDVALARWNAALAARRAWVAEHGDKTVPRSHLADGVHGPGTLALFHWQHQQRVLRRQGKLTDEQIATLDETGFDWTPRESAWDRNLAAARVYHTEHGHLRILEDQDVNGVNLGVWLSRLRADRRAGRLSDDKIAQLDELAFEWTHALELAWTRALERARAYYTKFGDLKVPTGFKAADGFNLYTWIIEQRVSRDKGTLSEERIAVLDELGMIWEREADHKRQINETLALARAFRDEHGHLHVPLTRNASPERKRLHAFLHRTRRAYQTGKLSPQRIKELDELGFQWNVTLLDRRWWLMFEGAREYATQHGNLAVPPDHRVAGGGNLSKWVEHQRRQRARGELADDRVKALTKIGMDWTIKSPGERRFDRSIEELVAFHREYGHFDVPCGYGGAKPGIGLYAFVKRQHRDHAAGTITDYRRRRLIEIGFVFQPASRLGDHGEGTE